jgi:FHS family L-fucose permease-like MFS transporter
VEALGNIETSFLMIAGLILVLLVEMAMVRGRLDRAAPAGESVSVVAALGCRWAILGATAIFLYVGAEVSIGSMMINFLHQPDILGISLDRASRLLSLYWLGAMVGRFVGSLVLRFVPAPAALTAVAAGASLLCLTVTQAGGVAAAVAAIAVGLTNAIMFPTIFTVTLERSTAGTAATAGLLSVAIVGGALLPLLSARIADLAGPHTAFLVPMLAYAAIAGFAFAAGRAQLGPARA